MSAKEQMLSDRTLRLISIAEERVNRELGSTKPLLGTRLYRALIAEEVLAIAAAQDESIPDEVVRRLTTLAHTYLTERYPA